MEDRIKAGEKVTMAEQVALEQSRVINPVERKTPTHGNKMTILEQMIGNLGRFRQNTKKKNNPENEIPGETGSGY